jgi:hypothetical protein
MDTRKYGSIFIKPDDVHEGPRQERIIHVYESEKYHCLVLELESGDQFSLNNSNTRILSKAYGWESDGWLGQVIELTLGHYKDWRSDPPGQEKETVLVRPISAQQPSSDNGGAKAIAAMARPPVRDPFSDEIPF